MSKYIIIIIVFTLSSCARLNSTYRHDPLGNNGNIVSVDAKQRFAISLGDEFCSEPSPDVFSVYAAAIEAKASKADELSAALKLSTSENGSTIGLRTEVIQLMRDAMYRLCEARISKSITKDQYIALLSKYQKSMVTLIAISQLTNAVKPNQVILSASSSISSGSQLYEAKEKLTQANKDLKAAKENKDKKEVEITTSDATFMSKAIASVTASAAVPATATTPAIPAVVAVPAVPSVHVGYQKFCIGTTAIPKIARTTNDDKKCADHLRLINEKSDLDIVYNKAVQNESDWRNVLEGEESKSNIATANNRKIIPLATNQLAKLTNADIKVIANTVKSLVKSVYSEEDFINQCLKNAQSNRKALDLYISSNDYTSLATEMDKTNKLDNFKATQQKNEMSTICTAIMEKYLYK